MNPAPLRRNSIRARRRVIALVTILALGPPAAAATLEVDTTLDEFDLAANATCSLREAVESTNLDADFGGCTADDTYGDDTILLPAGTYGLTRTPPEPFLDLDNGVGDLDVTDEVLEILGAGSGATVVQRASATPFGIFQTDFTALRLVDLTVAGGEEVAGAGIFSEFDLTLERVVVRDNVARAPDAGGGGIVAFGVLTMVDSLVTGNLIDLEDPCDVGPPTSGGGVLAFELGGILVQRSTIAGNTVTGDPGCEGFGGGLAILATGLGGTRIVNSTVSGNSASFVGGVDLLVADLLAGPVPEGLSGDGRGADRATRTGPGWAGRRRGAPRSGRVAAGDSHFLVSLEHVTITANSADEIGGLSLLSFEETGNALIENSLIGTNSAGDAPDCSNSGVNVTTQGTNLQSVDDPLTDEAVCVSGAPNLVGTLASPLDPLLLPLQNNGGATPTHALTLASPALDAAPDQGESEDQRGGARPALEGFDVGAYEVGALSALEIPTLGEWGLLLLTLGLLAAGVWRLRG